MSDERIIIDRLEASDGRRVWSVDVGNMSLPEAAEALNKIMIESQLKERAGAEQ